MEGTTSTVIADAAHHSVPWYSGPTVLSLGSATIALAALVMGIINLWRTHFATLHPISIPGCLRLRVYPIKFLTDRWFMVSQDLPISFCNPGAQPVIVTGLRLRLHFPGIPIPGNQELIDAKFEIDPLLAPRISWDRFQWIKELSPALWMPFVVLPKQTVLKHLIFETRWNDPVIQSNVEVSLEIRSSAKTDWSQISKWDVSLDMKHWVSLANDGHSMAYYDADGIVWGPQCTPEDLHKYTGTKETIPRTGVPMPASYLDYPIDSTTADDERVPK